MSVSGNMTTLMASNKKLGRTADATDPPKADRLAVSATVNKSLLKKLDTIARETGRNRSEMIDRLIEFYLQNHPERRLIDESECDNR